MEFNKCCIEGTSYTRGAYRNVMDMTMFFRVMSLCRTRIEIETKSNHKFQFEDESQKNARAWLLVLEMEPCFDIY
ncbi:hypothetical protein LXL04_025342 [Taraxacum kok-saghyz]